MDKHGIDDARWMQILRILDDALAVPEGERAAVIEQACEGDDELKQKVTRLLDTADSDAFERAAPDFASDLVAEYLPAGTRDHINERVGVYRIHRAIGSGGMGVVYLAEREDELFDQKVAIKFIGAQAQDDVSLQRFTMERQILANLDHPNLARLLDGGVADDSSSYIVMEYVEGLPITEYCEKHELGIDARLKVFEAVCEVVDYAHRKLVIHRDLKPSNILVASDGTVKLLDFGIAKLFDPDQPANETLTQPGASPHTPGYAAPEQLREQPVSTASDVYSLGVLLCELLSGELPYKLSGLTASRREQVVCEEPPTAPSRLATSENRRKHLEGDLDAIVLMALRKEPERRYDSARDLARDIERYRRKEPVSARPDSTSYKLRRFLRRNRVAVAGSAAIALALIGGLGASLWQANVASRERDQAREEAAKRMALSNALLEIISLSDPGSSPVDIAVGRQILDYAVERVDEQFSTQPDLLATVLLGIGKGYADMGEVAESRRILERAVALNTAAFGERSPEAAHALEALGNTCISASDYAAADSLFRKSIDIRLDHFDAQHSELAGCYIGLGTTSARMEKYRESEGYYRQALEIRLAQFGPMHDLTASGHANLATVQWHFDQEAAEANERKAIAIWEELGVGRVNLAVTYNNLAMKVSARGLIKEAVELTRKAVNVYRDLELEDARYANTLNTWAVFKTNAGEFASAEDTFREALEINITNVGENSLYAAVCHLGLSRSLVGLGRPEEALDHASSGHAILQSVLGDDHLFTATALAYTGDARWRSGDTDAGRSTLESALTIQRQKLPQSQERAAQSLFWLAQLHLQAGEPLAAEPMLREAIQFRLTKQPDTSWAIAEIQVVLAQCLNELGDAGAARDLLAVAVPNLVRSVGEEDHRVVAGQTLLDSLDL